MQSLSNSTACSFVHVDEATAERPHGGNGFEDLLSSDSDGGAGATAAAACGAATGASSVGSAAGAVAPGLASAACGAATGASSADSAAGAVAPGLAFDGRIVGFASVFVQRADGTMYVAPLPGPTPDSPFSWTDNRPYSQEQPPKRARSVSPADATGGPMDVDEPSLGAAGTRAPAAAAPATATSATAAAAPDPPRCAHGGRRSHRAARRPMSLTAGRSGHKRSRRCGPSLIHGHRGGGRCPLAGASYHGEVPCPRRGGHRRRSARSPRPGQLRGPTIRHSRAR